MTDKLPVLIYNSDWHKQRPLRFSECYNKSADEILAIFYSGNYRRNTGTFLMTDCLAKNLMAEHVSPKNLDYLCDSKPDVIITNGLHCISPEFIFAKEYWQKLLNTGAKIIPITLGFRYHNNGDFYLSDDMLYIIKQISERNEIGVRGERCAEILNSYGIQNVCVVGCHSLFYHMNSAFKVTMQKKETQGINRINFSFQQFYKDFFQSHKDFCRLSLPIFRYFLEKYENSNYNIDYTMQNSFYSELTGYDWFIGWNRVKDFVMSRGRYFFSVDDWIDALKTNEFTVSSQFHGGVASILAGVPTLLIAIDARMVELAEHHKIPYILPEQFDESKSIEYYYEIADYTDFNNYYCSNYEIFKAYCENNGVILKNNE